MTTKYLTLFLVGIFLAIVNTQSAAAQASRGAELYANQCGRCHNFRGAMEKSDREWEVIVGHMQSIGNMTGSQARAIKEYLQATNNPTVSAAPAVQAAAIPAGASGKEIFTMSGCIACHSIGGSGGAVGPKLDGVFDRRTKDYIVEQVHNSRSHNPSSVMPPMNLNDADMEKLLGYLKSGR